MKYIKSLIIMFTAFVLASLAVVLFPPSRGQVLFLIFTAVLFWIGYIQIYGR